MCYAMKKNEIRRLASYQKDRTDVDLVRNFQRNLLPALRECSVNAFCCCFLSIALEYCIHYMYITNQCAKPTSSN